MGEATGNADLAPLLADATAGLPGAESRFAARLRPELEAMLRQRLASPEAAAVSDAGALVQRHWQERIQIEGPAGSHGADSSVGGDTQATTGKKVKASRKGATKPRKAAKAAKGAPGGQGAGETPAPNPLFLPYVEQAAIVMQGLVRELAARTGPEGPVLSTLRALDALAELDPPLARVARLHWFGGLQHAAIAHLLGEGMPEVRRQWLKAHAFLLAATKGFAAPSPRHPT